MQFNHDFIHDDELSYFEKVEQGCVQTSIVSQESFWLLNRV